MAVEIERKFLVVGDEYRRMAYSSDRIVQGYICRADGNSVRVRIRDGRGYLTIKGPSLDGGLSRYEWEREISLAEAEDMLLLCRDAKIDKRRYLVKCGNHTYEVDEFYGENEGLVVAEVELDSIDEEFEKPPFLGEEVTGDAKYYNSSLTRYPYKCWHD
jgi:CYTH domain-containing protein